MLKLHVLASGSRGNAAIVEDATTGACIAIDSGICARDFMKRSEEVGVNLANLQAMLITHEHTDHTKGLGVTLRALAKKGVRFPVYVDSAVRAASAEIRKIVADFSFEDMRIGSWMNFGNTQVFPFATSHDAAASCGFRFEVPGDALGYMTDTGIVTAQAHDALSHVRILALEANHDEIMLRDGEYPYYLKERIASAHGHLSNVQSAEELDALMWSGLEHVVAMHISQNNNTYRLPVETLCDAVGAAPAPESVVPREMTPSPNTLQVRCAYQQLAVSVS